MLIHIHCLSLSGFVSPPFYLLWPPRLGSWLHSFTLGLASFLDLWLLRQNTKHQTPNDGFVFYDSDNNFLDWILRIYNSRLHLDSNHLGLWTRGLCRIRIWTHFYLHLLRPRDFGTSSSIPTHSTCLQAGCLVVSSFSTWSLKLQTSIL